MIEKLLLEIGAIKIGDFTFTSGMKSNYYMDMKYAATVPKGLALISKELGKHVKGSAIAGIELGAIPWLAAVSLETNKEFIMIRKTERGHGVKDPVIGKIVPGQEIDVIEDVVTTGGSALKVVNLLREKGAKVTRAIAIGDWEQGGTKLLNDNGVELITLVKASEITKMLK